MKSYDPNGRIFAAALLAEHPDPLAGLFARERDREQADTQAAEDAHRTAEETTRQFIHALTGNTAENTTEENPA